MAQLELFNYNKFYSTVDHYEIKNFAIYGERHSGTNWLEQSIKSIFDIPITTEYDHKHFFGCCDWKILNKAHNTLFIGITRNIYGWIGGMHKIPYHLSSKDILSIKPWQSEKNSTSYMMFCDSHWYTKKLYNDIFDMRHNKIEFLYLYMPYLVDNYIFIRYEDLIKHSDTIIKNINTIYNLKIINNYSLIPNTRKLNLKKLPNNYLNIINDDTIWTTENLIGYQKINSIDSMEYMT